MKLTNALIVLVLLVTTSCSSEIIQPCPKRPENKSLTYRQHLNYLGDLERLYDSCIA